MHMYRNLQLQLGATELWLFQDMLKLEHGVAGVEEGAPFANPVAPNSIAVHVEQAAVKRELSMEREGFGSGSQVHCCFFPEIGSCGKNRMLIETFCKSK